MYACGYVCIRPHFLSNFQVSRRLYCLKSNIEEVKSKIGGGEKADPDDPANRGKITEWEAGWNVTNAIQVRF